MKHKPTVATMKSAAFPPMKTWDYTLGKRAITLHLAADGVAAKYGCKVWLDWKGEGDDRVCVLRFMSDTTKQRNKIAALLDLLDKQLHVHWSAYRLERQRERHWDLRHNHIRSSFERGFCERISQRLETSARVSHAVQMAMEAKAKHLGIGLVRSHAGQFPDAYAAGVVTADKVNLDLRSRTTAKRQ